MLKGNWLQIEKERQTLERRVKRLRSSTLDPDLIDELARETLSMLEPDDVIILLEPDMPNDIKKLTSTLTFMARRNTFGMTTTNR